MVHGCKSAANNSENSGARAPLREGPLRQSASRSRGSGNRSKQFIEELLDGEAAALTRKAVALALDGDPNALRLCVERTLAPRRDRPVQLDLPPIRGAADIVDAMAAITNAVVQGDLTPGEAERLGRLIETYLRAIEARDFDARLKAVESDLGIES
jgi:hypothetical protein